LSAFLIPKLAVFFFHLFFWALLKTSGAHVSSYGYALFKGPCSSRFSFAKWFFYFLFLLLPVAWLGFFFFSLDFFTV